MNTQPEIPPQALAAQNVFPEALTLSQPSQASLHAIEPSFPARRSHTMLTQEQVLHVLARAQRDLMVITSMTGTWSSPGAAKIYDTAERCLGMLLAAAERLCPDAVREEEARKDAAKTSPITES